MEKENKASDKKVDESYKEAVHKEKETEKGGSSERPPVSFLNFLTSLGYQALILLGEMPHPETGQTQVDMALARETIDLLVLLEAKTKGNREPEEDYFLKTLLPEIQMKFVAKASA